MKINICTEELNQDVAEDSKYLEKVQKAPLQ